MDSDLEAFSRNPADGSFAALAFQLAAQLCAETRGLTSRRPLTKAPVGKLCAPFLWTDMKALRAH